MKKLLCILLSLVVLALGAYLINGLINSKPPSPRITAGETNVSTAQGSYCWNGFLNDKCVDMISPPEIVKHAGLKPIVVSPEAQLKIEFENEPENDTLGANIWMSNDKNEAVPVRDDVLKVPKEKGIYVYDIFARWEKGSSSYVFVIEVQ